LAMGVEAPATTIARSTFEFVVPSFAVSDAV
jgi:hypothetical protein